MGREVKRVPLDFNWPLKVTWEGYCNPHYRQSRRCPWCEYGYSEHATRFRDEWQAGDNVGDAWNYVVRRCEAEGVPTACAVCSGSGLVWPSPEAKHAYEEWEPTDPPSGDGWQMWETTSEGSPISPVFASPEELARWLADTGASAFGSQTASYDAWLGMIHAGSAPSAVVDANGLQSGVEFVGGSSERGRR